MNFFKLTVACILGFGTLISYSQNLKNTALSPVESKPVNKHQSLQLVKNGKLEFALVLDKNSENNMIRSRQSIHNAVEFLSKTFEKCTGSAPEIIDIKDFVAQEKYKYLILLGKSELTDKLGIKPHLMEKEGFEVQTFPGGVAIVGYDGSIIPESYNKMDWGRYRLNGTSHGAVDFAERILGCRFYYPGNYGSIYPTIKDLILEPFAYFDYPRFKNRYSWQMQQAVSQSKDKWQPEMGTYAPENYEILWRIGYGSRFDVTHSPEPHSYLALHPGEKDIIFYSAPNGHLYYNPKQHVGNYFDVTNLKFADMLIADWKKYYASNGKYGNNKANSEYIMFGNCDTFLPTLSNETVKRLKLIPESRKGNSNGELSDVYARFHIYLANKLKQELPGKRLAILPYQNYALPPVKAEYRKFPDNIDLRLCIGNYPLYTRNPEINEKTQKIFKDWFQVLGKRPVASLWLYNTPLHNVFGRAVVAQFVGEVPKILGENLGRNGMYFDYHGGLQWYFYYAYYVMYKSMWNPDFEVNAALDEHWLLMYGKAAPYLKEFHSRLVKNWIEYRAMTKNPENTYPRQELDQMEKLLKEAEKAIAEDSIEMKRLKLFLVPWPKAFAQMRGRLNIEKKVYRIRQLLSGQKINIDGEIDAVWENAHVFKMTDPLGSGSDPKYKVEGRLLWDKQGLYSLLVMDNQPQNDKSSSLWENSNIEAFISPSLEQREYFQFVVGATNQAHSGQRTLKPIPSPYNGLWKCEGFQHAVSVDKNRWVLEMFIPFAGMNLSSPRPGECWLGNFVRNKKSKPQEYSSFAPTLGNNHETNMFNMFKFLSKGD